MKSKRGIAEKFLLIRYFLPLPCPTRRKMNYCFNRIGKKGIVTDYLPWILIAVAVLVILSVTIFVLQGKGISAIDTIKNLFRSG
ncbi:MAG: hypothetical protein K8R91_01035 [Phycisphaerae bacterium]|nr:hypothetical protein [Phycisphaerae bacterium]